MANAILRASTEAVLVSIQHRLKPCLKCSKKPEIAEERNDYKSKQQFGIICGCGVSCVEDIEDFGCSYEMNLLNTVSKMANNWNNNNKEQQPQNSVIPNKRYESLARI